MTDKTVSFIGPGERFSHAVAERLRREGYRRAEAGPVDAVVINAIAPTGASGFLDLADETFVRALDGFVDLLSALQPAMARLREGGAIVALTTRGYLGAWGDAHEAAFSGALVGLMRSVALESTPRGVRANVVACDYAPQELGGDRREHRDQGERIAAAVVFFLGEGSRAINGEILLANAGRGLQRREARDRRDQLGRAAVRLQQRTSKP